MAPDGIFLLDPKTGKVIEANETFRKIAAVGTDDIPEFPRFLQQSKETAKEILETLKKPDSTSIITPFFRTDGTRFFAELKSAMIPSQGEPAILVHLRDITTDYETRGINGILMDLDRMILNGDPFEKLVSTVVERISSLFGLTCTFFMLPVETGELRI
ncbi:diguanylate cyclase/phosphodiesterase with PAS/PAC and GAF sensor(s), partial [mine drainage metagenome]